MANDETSANQESTFSGERRPRAVALGYDPARDDAPRVLASGKGNMAEQIIALARSHQIPIREDPVLVQALEGVDLNQTIPPELYLVVAEVLAFIYRIREGRRAAR